MPSNFIVSLEYTWCSIGILVSKFMQAVLVKFNKLDGPHLNTKRQIPNRLNLILEAFTRATKTAINLTPLGSKIEI